MIRALFPVLVLLVSACGNKKTAHVHGPVVLADTAIKQLQPSTTEPFTTYRNEIIPGQRIGSVTLNMNGDSVVALLGKPDRSDAAMGKAWLVWTGETGGSTPHETDIYTARRMGMGNEESRVKEIRVTSPFFHTADSIAVGRPLAFIRAKLPRLHKISATTSARRKSFYDDPSRGIAFEFDGPGKCLAILVHEKNKNLSEIYLPLEP